MSKNIKNVIRRFLMVIAVVAIIYSAYNLIVIKKEEKTAETVNKEVVELVGQDENNQVKFLTKSSFRKLIEINSDFVGYLYYPSLNIFEQVVQTDNNEYYLHHAFDKKQSPYGTVFVDYNQNIGLQNTTLYGHWVSDSSLKFSNLHKLKNQDKYDQYKTFYYADENYIYEYQVGIVIYHHTIDDFENIPYWEGEFDQLEFANFIENAKSKAFYDSGLEFKFQDNLMTLQTCITFDSEERLVVIGKEISKTPLTDD